MAEPFPVVCSMYSFACFAHLATLRVLRCALESTVETKESVGGGVTSVLHCFREVPSGMEVIDRIDILILNSAPRMIDEEDSAFVARTLAISVNASPRKC